jgi:NTE family protein
MEVTRFTDEVFHLVEDLKRDIKDDDGKVKQFSDIVDDQGLQYVDIVMEGGGVLGIALVGFTYVLEEAGIRFLQIGGASAGAINALLIAGMGTPAEAKSVEILKELASVDMYEFVDGDSDSKDFIDAVLRYGRNSFANAHGVVRNFIEGIFQRGGKAVVYTQAIQVWDNIRDNLGLNPGNVFQKWIEDILRNKKITTTGELLDRLNHIPAGLRHRDPKQQLDVKPALALIAADVSTQTKVIFPKMAELYWKNPDKVNPSNYVRASMSIPFFFEPYRVNNIPKGEVAMGCWAKLADYKETLPKSCTFIDGGIMSNFPINLFHRPDRVPSAPTFGVKLGTDKKKTETITQPFKLLSVIFDSARFNLDSDFIARNPDYRKLVSCIDTSDHRWLNFKMSDEDKIDLFKRGAAEAAKFLREFDWVKYKKIREGMKIVVKRAGLPENGVGEAVQSPTV